MISIDIEPKMIERVQQRAQMEGITNLEAKIAGAANFQLKAKLGNFFAYTLIFEKQL